MGNKSTALKPVVETVGSTPSFFTQSTFGSRLGGATSRMFRGDGLMSESESELQYSIVKKEGRFQRGKLCFSLVL